MFVIVIGVEFVQHIGTPGGARLRALREAAGRTQLWVEAEADLGTGYVQRIESGRVVQPERATLERVLNALDARYSERWDVLERFGYVASVPLPTAAEMAWARALSAGELAAVTFPAYVLDCTHRLVAWNGYIPRTFGLRPDDATLGGVTARSLLAAWFDLASPIGRRVAEPDALLPAMIRAMRYEMQQFRAEPWYADVLAALESLPRFRHYAAVADAQPAVASAARALVPVRLAMSDGEVLAFHLSSERFQRDARFRLVYFFPADPKTMRQCADWASQGW